MPSGISASIRFCEPVKNESQLVIFPPVIFGILVPLNPPKLPFGIEVRLDGRRSSSHAL